MPAEKLSLDFYVWRNHEGVYVAPGTSRAWAWVDEFMPTEREFYGPRLLVDKALWPIIKATLQAQKFTMRVKV